MEDDFDKFENHFNPTHLVQKANPFLNRTVVFSINECCDPRGYFAVCLRFLRKYGAHIWHCNVDQWSPYSILEEQRFYSYWLQRILELMPNLRSFIIDTSQAFPNEVMVALNGRPSERFPHLPYLEHLSIQGLPTTVSKALIEKNPQLRSLDASDNMDVVLLQFLPNLKKLTLDLWDKEEFDKFTSAKFFTCVEYLCLDIRFLTSISLKRVFHLVETHLSQSLVELDLALSASHDQNVALQVKLPCLKTLRLKLKSPEPIYFLEQFKDTLERLELILTQPLLTGDRGAGKVNMPGRIQHGQDLRMFDSVWVRPNESEIWLQLPKLLYLKTETRFPGKWPTVREAWRHWKIATGKSLISGAGFE